MLRAHLAAVLAADHNYRAALSLALIKRGGVTDAATPQFEWLAEAMPGDPVILNNLASSYDLEHDVHAKQIAERALKLAPHSGSVADTLG